MAAWGPDMVRKFYFVKNFKIVNNSATAEAREKIGTDLESLNFNDVGFSCKEIEEIRNAG